MTSPLAVWDREEFVDRLRAVGAKRYHHLHPLHVLMNAGKLAPEAIREWVRNRFYYQISIPIKDAAILSNCPLRDVRRVWRHRIEDHDGFAGGEKPGGIESWLRLGAACGIPAEEMFSARSVLPGVRFAVDAYVNFTRSKPWPVAVASSLTELFAPDLMADRLRAFETYYTWVQPWGFDYFKKRLTQARTDSNEGLELTIRYCDTPALQQQAVEALEFKCDVLWTMLDAVALACCAGLPSSPTEGPHESLKSDAKN
jgi:pyrroloquinoline-quinone synthase